MGSFGRDAASLIFVPILLALSACASVEPQAGSPASPAASYVVSLDERTPAEARVELALPPGANMLKPARDGDGAGIDDVRCADGRKAVRAEAGWQVPPGCTRLGWAVVLDDIDAAGLDASLPSAALSRRHDYWIIPERDGFLRASDEGGSAVITLRRRDGGVVERRYLFPSDVQPPFYAVIGDRPTLTYAGDGVTLAVFGAPPAYPWMDEVHAHVLASWARWRRDLVTGEAPSRIDWAWVQPTAVLEPGYNASAGAEAIISQIRLREGDPDAEAKARAVIGASAAHEGFHTITGAAGQAWPAWVNESLANHYAIEATRAFLSPSDFRFIERFYIEPEARRPLLEAQAAYGAGDGEQAQIFYVHGAAFWRAIEAVLTNPPNGSGRLAALIKASDNFRGVDLNDADALAAWLDRHSAGRGSPIVRCYLQGRGCPP